MANSTDSVILYHHPFSRARVVHWMLEEVGAPYELKIMNFENDDLERPEFLAINPMGRVPAIQHRGIVVTETAAICAYLADAFPRAGLAPPLDSPLRGPYLRWLFFAVSCVEPAVSDHLFPRATQTPYASIGYGPFEQTLGVLKNALSPGPFLLGQTFSAADVYVSALIGWYLMTKAIEPNPIFDRYLKACQARPACQRIEELSKA